MIFLLLSILCSTIIFINFKLFVRYQVHTLQAIVINYTVCVSVGLLAQWKLKPVEEIIAAPWFLPSLLLGSMFITVFYITALTVRYSGVAVASIAGKLSLIIPAVAAYFLYNDKFDFLKICGIVIAILAVIFVANKKTESGQTKNARYFLFPVFILLGNGVIDTFTKYNQENYVLPEDFNFFLVFVFGTSACMGWAVLLFRKIRSGEGLAFKSILFGITLGLPNYGSMYFLIQALERSTMQSSVFFPVNNICILVLSCLCAAVFFKEKLSKLNVIGILLSIIAIVCIMMS